MNRGIDGRQQTVMEIFKGGVPLQPQ